MIWNVKKWYFLEDIFWYTDIGTSENSVSVTDLRGQIWHHN